MSREADADPAEPTEAVVWGASATASVGSSCTATARITLGDSLADLGGGAVQLGGELALRVGIEPHAGGGRVVEALRVGDVLEADGEADAAADALASRRVAGASGQPDRLARQRLRLGDLQLRRAADHLGHRQGAGHDLPGRHRPAGAERVELAELDGVDGERGGELVHLRLRGEAGLHRAEPAHGAARRVVGVDAGRLDVDVRD